MVKSLHLAFGLASLLTGCPEKIERVPLPSTYEVEYFQNNQITLPHRVTYCGRRRYVDKQIRLPPLHIVVGPSPYYPHIIYGPGGSFVSW